MTKVVYTSASQTPLRELLSPWGIAQHLWRHRELIRSQARREFEATYRANVLGLAWIVLTPLIMLLLFTFVFGYVFKGRFNPNTPETPAEFAVALFVGLSLYQVIGNTLTGSCGLMLANTDTSRRWLSLSRSSASHSSSISSSILPLPSDFACSRASSFTARCR